MTTRSKNRIKKAALLLALLAVGLSAALLGRRQTELTPTPDARTLAPPAYASSVRASHPRGASPGRLVPLPDGPPVVARVEGPARKRLLEPQLLPPSTNSPLQAVPASTRYYDQLIDPSQPVDPTPTAPATGASSHLPGGASVEYRLFDQTTNFGTSRHRYTEHGVGVTAQQETRDFGRFELRGAQTDVRRSDGFNDFQGDGYLNLAQRDFALSDRWVMNNELGHIRALSPVEVASGYRIRLPTPLIEGAVAEANSPDLSLRLSLGSLGTYRGRTFPVFSTDGASGRVNGAAGSYRLNPNWSVGAQLWQSDGVTTGSGERDFTTWAGGLRFDGREADKAQFNALYNDHGATGLWTDGERRFGAWLHDAGFFRLDPDLEWVDRYSAIQNDIEGAYWRATTRSFRNTISTGVDWSRTNIKDDPPCQGEPTRRVSPA